MSFVQYISNHRISEQRVHRHMRQLVDTQVRKYGLCIIKVLQFDVLTVSLAVKLPTYVASSSSYVSFFTMAPARMQYSIKENSYGQTMKNLKSNIWSIKCFYCCNQIKLIIVITWEVVPRKMILSISLLISICILRY